MSQHTVYVLAMRVPNRHVWIALAAALLLGVAVAAGSALPITIVQPSRDSVDTIAFETTEATRLAFDIAPDGSSIVFDLLGQLWRIPSSGGDATPITNAVRDIAEDFDPAIAPDGRSIVFQSDRPGGRALWLLREHAPPRRLTSRFMEYFAYAAPAWSPDGRRIAYSIGDTLALIDVANGSEVALRIDSLPPAAPRAGFTPRNASPTWSPDGKHIAFVNAAPGAVRGEGRAWQVAADGGVARPLTTMPVLAPVWSPSGSRLGFFARDSANRWQVWVLERDSARRLTSHQEVVTYRVRWSTDARSLIYAADGGLWRVSTDGGSPVAIPFRARLTIPRRRATLPPVTFARPGEPRTAKGFAAVALSPDGRRVGMIALDSLWIGEVGSSLRSLGSASNAGDNALTWSPDGTQVAWTKRERAGRPFGLMLTNISTGATRVLASLGQDIIAPTWAPDGSWIAFIAARRLRLVDPRLESVAQVEQTRDLGPANVAWGTMAWSRGSNALVVAALDFATRAQRAEWIPLAGGRRPVPGFPRSAANLLLTADGNAIWVEDNRLWRATFDDSLGFRGARVLGGEAALEARHSRAGNILYLSSGGLRLRQPNGTVRPIPWPLRYRVRAAPKPVLLRGARVIDGRGSPLSEPRDVLLQDGRIARIAPAGTLPNGAAQLVDATGTYLLPGFIDLHSHLWDDLRLVAQLYHGVTTVRDIASQALKTPDTRNGIEAGVIEGPRVVYGGAMYHGIEAGYSTLTDQMPTDSASIARSVSILAALDGRYVKERGFSGWWRAVHLVREAHRRGMVVSGHCEHILPVIAAGIDGAEHVLDCFRDRYTMRADFVELARAAKLWIVPTAALRYSMLRGMDDPNLINSPDIGPFLVPSYRSLYSADSANRRNAGPYTTTVQRLMRGVGRYHAAGVMQAAGTDSPFPLGIQHEMEVFVQSGMTPMQAIVAATGLAARVLNAPSIGTVVEGQLADLVVLSANPLDDIRNVARIQMVIQGGRIIDREALRRRALP